MWKSISLFFLLCFSTVSAREAVPNSIAIGCIFKDEAKYLPEWIEFHENQGISHFYLYNNLSTDNYQETLEPYIARGLVELIDWPKSYVKWAEWDKIQCESYMDCVHRAKKTHKWCAFLDTDEFLFVVDGTPLTQFLTEYNEFPGVCVHWVMYGTSHVEKVPEGRNLRDYLVYRAPIDYFENRHFKCIVQPKCVVSCKSPHTFIYRYNVLPVNEKKAPQTGWMGNSVTVDKIRINHYWVRDLDFFYNVKIPRRVNWRWEYDWIIKCESEMNAEYDPILAGSWKSEA